MITREAIRALDGLDAEPGTVAELYWQMDQLLNELESDTLSSMRRSMFHAVINVPWLLCVLYMKRDSRTHRERFARKAFEEVASGRWHKSMLDSIKGKVR